MEINVEQNEYVGQLTKDAGIRVHIGEPGKVPFPYEKGFSVGPGSATSVGMKKVWNIFIISGTLIAAPLSFISSVKFKIVMH